MKSTNKHCAATCVNVVDHAMAKNLIEIDCSKHVINFLSPTQVLLQ